MFFAIFSIYALVIDHVLNLPPETLKVQKDLLEQGRYDEIDVDRIVKGNGWIEILDPHYNVIYRNGNVQEYVASYTQKEMESISDYYETFDRVESYKIKEKNGQTLTLLLKKGSPKEDPQNQYASVEMLDEEYNVIYRFGNDQEEKKHYTKRELEYMTGTYFQRYQVKKYDFQDQEGNSYFLIAKIDHQHIEGFLGAISRNSKYMVYLFLFLYILNVTLFIIYLNRKVKKPLEKINKAMTAFAEEKSNQKIEFEGPREFMQICDSFNVMVTKLKKSEEERRQLEEEKQKMLSDISHDLKTPFTIIQGYAKALADGVIKDEKQQRKYLNTIYQKSMNVTELIDLFQEYNKLEHPDFKFHFTRQNISELLRNYIAERYDYITEQGFEIEVDISEKELLCDLDKNQIQRVFENIISNSIKHNSPGTTIEITLQEMDHLYKITISDDGVGIPEDIGSRIFDAFVVGDESRNPKQGTGLGLAIAKRIVEKHNGKIQLISQKEERFKTKFEICIPKA